MGKLNLAGCFFYSYKPNHPILSSTSQPLLLPPLPQLQHSRHVVVVVVGDNLLFPVWTAKSF